MLDGLMIMTAFCRDEAGKAHRNKQNKIRYDRMLLIKLHRDKDLGNHQYPLGSIFHS